ncbi:MAG: hypothetical protein Fur0017_28260 [Anaerolineales bacterium]
MQYINSEWEKKADDRFDEYLSPVLLWLLSAVIPTTLGFVLTSGSSDFMKEFWNRIYPVTFYMMIIPFIHIAWAEWLNKERVKRSTLKISFYRHCYALAPAQIITVFLILLSFIPGFTPLTLAALVTIPIYEAFVFKAELGVSYVKAFLYACIPQAVMIILFLAILGGLNSAS